jgi:hypothetical protein
LTIITYPQTLGNQGTNTLIKITDRDSSLLLEESFVKFFPAFPPLITANFAITEDELHLEGHKVLLFNWGVKVY